MQPQHWLVDLDSQFRASSKHVFLCGQWDGSCVVWNVRRGIKVFVVVVFVAGGNRVFAFV